MNGEQDRNGAAGFPADLPAAEARAREVVRGLPAPPSDPAFRERLRRDFASGAIRSPLDAARTGRSGFRRRAVLALAAAVVLAVLGAWAVRLNRGPGWVLAGSTGAGTVLLDEQEIPLASLGGRLAAGRGLELGGDLQLYLLCSGTFALQATPGSIFTLPPSPGRWVGRRLRGEVRAGEVRIVAGPLFRGAELVLAAPDADIEVSGTTFAVICEPGATCLCVLEGEVTMISRDGRTTRVPAGMRRTVYRNGAPPLVEPIRDMERMKLGMLTEQSRPLLEGGRQP